MFCIIGMTFRQFSEMLITLYDIWVKVTFRHAIWEEYGVICVEYVWVFSVGKAFPGRFIFFLAKDVYGHSQITLIYYLPSLPNVTLPFMGKNTIELIIIPLRWYMYVFPII